MSMGVYHLKSCNKKVLTLEKFVFIFCLSISIATFCAEPNAENQAQPLQPEYTKEEMPTGVPPHQSVDAEQSQHGILLIDGPYYPEKVDEKLHTTCCCIIQ